MASKAIVIGLTALLLAACHSKASAYNIESTIEPSQAHVGPVAVSIRLADPFAKPVKGAFVELEGDMSHPGMAPVFGAAKETTPGLYRGSVTLNMPGDWVILVHSRLPGGVQLEKEIPLPGVRK